MRRIVLTHFHDDHSGSAAEIAAWGNMEIIAGKDDADYITGARQGPLARLTVKETVVVGEPTSAPHAPVCKVDRVVDDGDVLDFAGGARVISAPGHTPGSIALYLPAASAVLFRFIGR